MANKLDSFFSMLGDARKCKRLYPTWPLKTVFAWLRVQYHLKPPDIPEEVSLNHYATIVELDHKHLDKVVVR